MCRRIAHERIIDMSLLSRCLRRPHDSGTHDHDVTGGAPGTRRRDLITAGLATAAAAIAVGTYAEPALAHDPDDVALGGMNPATLPTYISRANGGSVLYLDNTAGTAQD